MAVGDSGRPIKGTVQFRQPEAFAARVGRHIHDGPPEATVGGPGCTDAPGASQQGASGSSPYGSGGDSS